VVLDYSRLAIYYKYTTSFSNLLCFGSLMLPR